MRSRRITLSLGLIILLALLGLYLTRTTSPNPPSHKYVWGIIGNDDSALLQQEWDAGVRTKIFSLSWRKFYPVEGQTDAEYITQKRDELSQLHNFGFAVIVDLGLHHPPKWLHDNYSDTYYVNQYGERFVENEPNDNGDANLVFNPKLRELASTYMHDIFVTFGTDFTAVRLGGGRYGELTYPPAKYNGKTNVYWAFDALTNANNPVKGWLPGQPSDHNEAKQFLTWYLDQLVDFQNWQVTAVRAYYPGNLMMLYPSWGIRPGDIDKALAGNLDGSSSAEKNGEIQRGFDFERQIAALNDPHVIVTTTWLDADASGDDKPEMKQWSPVKYLAYLAQKHPLKLALFGENTGQGDITRMRFSASQMQHYGLIGLAWFSESELTTGKYATFEDYRRVIHEFK